MINALLIAAPKLDCHKRLYILQFSIYRTVYNTHIALHSNYPASTEQDAFSLSQLHLSTKISLRDLHSIGETHLKVSNRSVGACKSRLEGKQGTKRVSNTACVNHVHHF